MINKVDCKFTRLVSSLCSLAMITGIYLTTLSCHRSSEYVRKIEESRKNLLSAIDMSSEIRICEQSVPNDFPSKRDNPYYVYKDIALSSDQVIKLREIVSSYRCSADRDTDRLSMIEPHHMIIFKNSKVNATDLTLQISFGSGSIEGGVNSHVFDRLQYPQELVKKLEIFFIEIGLRPRADWRKLASEIKDL